LSHFDYFFGGHFKNKVYATKPHNLEDLRNRTVHEAFLIILEQINNVMINFYESTIKLKFPIIKKQTKSFA